MDRWTGGFVVGRVAEGREFRRVARRCVKSVIECVQHRNLFVNNYVAGCSRLAVLTVPASLFARRTRLITQHFCCGYCEGLHFTGVGFIMVIGQIKDMHADKVHQKWNALRTQGNSKFNIEREEYMTLI